MEIFKKTNFDFLRWKWHFIGASLILSVAGIVSLAINGGPKLGIEFKGGMEMTVKFANDPPVEKIRAALTPVLSSAPTVQSFEGGASTGSGSNEVVIGTGGDNDQVL